jgi:arsenite methyltransferase
MSVPAMIAHLLLERFSKQVLPRIPETEAVMAASDQVRAFQQGGSDDGILKHIYFFHAVMSLPVIRPGDTVLDLACGPANQLVHVARLNPDANFIGIDASLSMLELAHDTLVKNQIANATLRFDDMTRLSTIASSSIDCAMCTMSLHHLPDINALDQTLREIRRVLKPGGGIYLADFGRLKRATTQKYFAHDRIELQSQAFTDDFLNSMRAAFSVEEFKAALNKLGATIPIYQTALAPFMVIARSDARRSIDKNLEDKIQLNYRNLTTGQQRDFDNMVRWFRMGGLNPPIV